MAGEFRQWKDATGKFSVEARFIAIEHNSVRLETTAGRIVHVPIQRLSQQDQEFLETRDGSAAPVHARSVAQTRSSITEALAGKPLPTMPGESLKGFLARLDIPTFIKVYELQAMGLSPSLPIGSASEAKTLADQLDVVLKQHELSWYALQTVLVITASEEISPPVMQNALYRLPVARKDFPGVLAKLEAIEPDSWDLRGGWGSIAIIPPYFAVRQTAHIHRELSRELDTKPITQRYVHPLDQVSISLSGNRVPLKKICEQLEQQLKREVVLADSELQKIGLTGDMPMSVDLKAVSAKDALDLLTEDIACTWLVEQNGRLMITTKEAAETMLETRRIRLPIASPLDKQSPVQAIQRLVAPDTWENVGGSGQIQALGNQMFSVTQSQPVFRELSEFASLFNPKP